jgi:hypothetical protein
MEISKIKETVSEAIRLMIEQRISPDSEKEYCDSLCCSEAQEILEDLLEKL